MNLDFNKIIQGDCLEVMQQLPNNSIDLIVTSPPYNLKNSTGNGMKDRRGGKWKNAELVNGYSHYNDCMPHEEYMQWQRKCLTEMLRIIPNDGAPSHFQADLEVDNWVKTKDGWLIGISCKRTIRERWKNVSNSIEVYNSRRLKHASQHVGLKNYVRPISQLINDIRKDIK